MTKKRIVLIAVALASVVGLLVGGIPSSPVRAQEGPNLLRNGNFEEGGGSAWPFQDGIAEVQVAPGWRAFYLDDPPPYAIAAEHCNGDVRCSWARPEFRDIKTYEAAERIHSGNYAQKYFTYGRQHEAGLMQQVGGISPGTSLLFQVYIQTWSCLQDEPNHCPTSPYSNQPAPMHIRVGIDPTGGTNPWAGTVVWSAESNAWDAWTLMQVEATAEAETVTVFTYSRPDWTDTWARLHNDVYVDDASLIATTPPTNTPLPPPPTNTPGPSPTPRPTATPRPDGAIVHVVQAGETLYGVALQYGVSSEQIAQLNAGSLGPNNMLYVGQELVISIPSEPPTPTVPPTSIAPPTPETGSVCVLAYNDRNGDTFRQPDTEEMLPNASFSLGNAGGLTGQYNSDGVSEPYCFTGLTAGSYRIIMQPPPGFVASGPSEWVLAQEAPSRVDVAFGARQGEGTAGTATPAVALPRTTGGNSGGDGSDGTSTLRWVAGIVGILLIAAAVTIGVLYVLSQRRRTLSP